MYLLIHEDGFTEQVSQLPEDVSDSLEAGILDVVRWNADSFQSLALDGTWNTV